MGKHKKALAQGKEEAPSKPEAKEAEAPADAGKVSKVSAAAYAAGGVGAGIVSYFAGTDYGLLLGAIILFILSGAVMKLTGKKKLGGWAASGIFLYLFLWLDAWAFLYNFL